METTAFHFHCSDSLALRMPMCAGTDARDVMWLDIDASDPKVCVLCPGSTPGVPREYPGSAPCERGCPDRR